MNEKKQTCDEADAFRRSRSITESGNAQSIEEFNRAALDEARGHAAGVDNESGEKDYNATVETAADHERRIARARRGL